MVAEAPAEPEGRSELETLLEVQDLDTVISQLRHRKATLPARQELARLSAALAAADRRAAEVEESRAALLERQRALEGDIATTTARREALEQRMYGARGGSARELQAMDDEIRHLRQRTDQMEDAELEVMVALEPLDVALEALEAERAELRAHIEQLGADLGAAEAEIDAELAELVAKRDAAASGLPEELCSRYESLRARLGGVGAARLVGNRCSGCHLELPAMEVDRIRRLPRGTVVTCEQCGRILVPTAAPGAPRGSARRPR
ncbi:MAG: C4-type zinc ribbon domain-containing protein [Actinomycetota bacterium]|nr:C4-type zinc ribbon domain-containing protein [Actinomycetota bacterium]